MFVDYIDWGGGVDIRLDLQANNFIMMMMKHK